MNCGNYVIFIIGGLGFKLPRGTRVLEIVQAASASAGEVKCRRSFVNYVNGSKDSGPNMTEFLTSSSRADRECTEERDGSSPPKRSKHRETFDPS